MIPVSKTSWPRSVAGTPRRIKLPELELELESTRRRMARLARKHEGRGRAQDTVEGDKMSLVEVATGGTSRVEKTAGQAELFKPQEL